MASLKDVQLDAMRSTDQPSQMWVMRVRYTPLFSSAERHDQTQPGNAKHHYRVKAALRDQHVNGFFLSPGASTGSPGHPANLTIDDHDHPQTLRFTVPAADMFTEALGDGAPIDRVDVLAHVEIFDLSVSTQVAEGHKDSPGLDLYVI
jgi:hypothetical protein